jgi:hypothetical protein
MRWVRRITLSISMLLAVLSAGYWIATQWRTYVFVTTTNPRQADGTVMPNAKHERQIRLARGCIEVEQSTYRGGAGVLLSSQEYSDMYSRPAMVPRYRFASDRHFAGFGFNAHGALSEFWIPLWFPTVVFALGPAVWLVRRCRRGKLTPGACRQCG